MKLHNKFLPQKIRKCLFLLIRMVFNFNTHYLCITCGILACSSICTERLANGESQNTKDLDPYIFDVSSGKDKSQIQTNYSNLFFSTVGTKFMLQIDDCEAFGIDSVLGHNDQWYGMSMSQKISSGDTMNFDAANIGIDSIDFKSVKIRYVLNKKDIVFVLSFLGSYNTISNADQKSGNVIEMPIGSRLYMCAKA